MWKTRQKMWETCGKHVENCPKNVENFVDKMWECGKHVGNSFVCTNVQNCRQLYKRKSIFFLFLSFFSFFFFFSCTGTYVSVCGYVCVCGGALQLYALAHGTERERRTCNEWLCTGVMITFVGIYILVSYCLYIQVFNIFKCSGVFTGLISGYIKYREYAL